MKNRYVNWYFLLPALFFLGVCYCILFVTKKGEPEFFINRHSNIFLDWFFYLITEGGTGWFFTLVAVALLFVKYADGLFLGMQGILVAICSNVCKHVIFTNESRPPAFFDKSVPLHFISWSEKFYTGSFPSGHTMTAFCMFCTLSFFVRDKKWGVLFCGLAVLIAFSRLYLLRHFLFDVSVAGIIGLAISFITLIYVYPMFERVKVLQGSVLKKR
jgi:membrane-associated phospholipid phosphatase